MGQQVHQKAALEVGGDRIDAGTESQFARRLVSRAIAIFLGLSALSFVSVQFMPFGEFTAVVMTTPLGVTLLASGAPASSNGR